MAMERGACLRYLGGKREAVVHYPGKDTTWGQELAPDALKVGRSFRPGSMGVDPGNKGLMSEGTLEKRRHVLAQKIVRDPNSGQETYFHQVPGVARFVSSEYLSLFVLAKTVRYCLAASTSIKRDVSLEVGGDQEFATNSDYPLADSRIALLYVTTEYPTFKKKGRQNSFTGCTSLL